MIQGCFSNPTSPTRNKPDQLPTCSNDNASKESLITCIYQTRLLDSLIYLTLTWSKTSSSHTLTIHAPHCFSLTISLLPSTFSFFRTRSGSKSKSIRLDQAHNYKNLPEDCKIKLYYDFTRAESTRSNSAELGSGFYLAIVCDGRVEFVLGDMKSKLIKRLGLSRLSDSVEMTLLSRREHVFGRRTYTTSAEFLGAKRLVEIECSGGTMKVKIDEEVKLHVKRLAWKFRGNEKIFVNGIGVEFYWDVFNWVNNNYSFKHGNNSSNNESHGVFVFQVGEGGVCVPEVVGPEKKLMRKNSLSEAVSLSPAGSSSSVWQWAEESSECGRSSSGSFSTATARFSGSFGGGGNGEFSLVLYAWRS